MLSPEDSRTVPVAATGATSDSSSKTLDFLLPPFFFLLALPPAPPPASPEPVAQSMKLSSSAPLALAALTLPPPLPTMQPT